MSATKVYEQGDRYYFVGAVSPLTPGEHEISEYAFAEEIKRIAPNENILWLRGNYVEADSPNDNGQMWTADEIAVKHLTPNFMPVTVMHDPRTAVGLIADTALLTPSEHQVKNSRIDTTLAVWGHRFPEVAEEAHENYRQGTLMQSMEAVSPSYSCSECGKLFHKLPEGAEKANWCEHLKGESGVKAARILGNVTFTGTGLIFGTRDGARGANGKAHLELSLEELAHRHEEAHSAVRTSQGRTSGDRKVSTVETKEISQHEYETLKQTEGELAKVREQLAEAENAKSQAEQKVTEVEQAKIQAEQERDQVKQEKEGLEEEARKRELASERLEGLGQGFTSQLGDFTQKRLREDAQALDDEHWEARLKELEETTGRKRDDGTEPPSNGGGTAGGENSLSSEELARAGVGATNRNGGSSEPSPGERRSVAAGLLGNKK